MNLYLLDFISCLLASLSRNNGRPRARARHLSLSACPCDFTVHLSGPPCPSAAFWRRHTTSKTKDLIRLSLHPITQIFYWNIIERT